MGRIIKKLAPDSQILLFLFETDSRHGEDAKQLFLNSARINVELLISELVYLEEFSAEKLSDHKAKYLLNQAKKLPIKSAMIFEAIIINAAKLRRDHRQNIPDAIQVATALELDADQLVTNDKKMLKLKIPNLKLATLKQAVNGLNSI